MMLAKPEVKISSYHHETTRLSVPHYPEPFPLLQIHSPKLFMRKILTHNSYNGYTGILTIGHSGSGKTTCVGMMIHNLHEERPFAVNNYSASDLMDVGQIIKKMPKAPTILHFDDASYSLAEMSDSERNKLASGLTTIRHEVRNPVITFLNIHYSKALEKFFRDTDFKILTSISDEEMDNFQKLFGYKNRYKLYTFANRYRAMLLYGNFRVHVGKHDYTYTTHNPFRIALVSELGRLHSMLYYKDACGICSPTYHPQTIITAQEFVDKLVSAYGRNKARACIRWWLYFNKNMPKAVERDHRNCFEMLNEMAHNAIINSEEVQQLIETELRHNRQEGFEKSTATIHAMAEEGVAV